MELGAIHFARWALYADLGLLLGMPLFALYTLRAEPVPRAFLLVLAGAGIALTLISLQLTAAAMADAPVMRVDPELLTLVIGQTGFGRAALVRLALLAALVPATLLAKNAQWLFAVLGGGALLTLVWGGHGGSTEGASGVIHLASGLVHLLAGGAWLGALAMFLRLSRAQPDLFHSALRRFSIVGAILVAALAASGAINIGYEIDLDQRSWLPRNIYEQLLLLKLVLFGGMVMLAMINRFLLTPKLALHEAAGGPAPVRQALQRTISIEFGLAVVILALVAWFGTMDPGA